MLALMVTNELLFKMGKVKEGKYREVETPQRYGITRTWFQNRRVQSVLDAATVRPPYKLEVEQAVQGDAWQPPGRTPKPGDVN